MAQELIADLEKTPGSQPGDESSSDMSSSLEETPRYQRGEDVITEKKQTILLVEDDLTLQEMYREVLISHGYTVIKAGDGQEALDLFCKEKIDLIITDIMMPKMSGVELLNAVRKIPQEKPTPAIAWSNLTYEDEKKQALAAGANEYIIKDSLGLDEIIGVVKKYLG